MKEQWYIQTKKADFNGIAAKFHISPITARLIRNRDVVGEEEIRAYLYPDIKQLNSPWLLKDMDIAVELLKIKIHGKNKIRIICDYDVDGICSGYLLYRTLKELQAEVDIVVPHRISDGYGINEKLIQKAYDDGVDTILTCDNGIAAFHQVEFAKSLGMTVIITDHHEVPFEEENGEKVYLVPHADAVINQKQPDCPYPYKELCGTMVAFQLIHALYDSLGYPLLKLHDLLVYAAIATVCDVVDLTGENRMVVRFGLEQMKKIKDVGLNALIDACNLDKEHLGTYHLGFVLGPCLNASGRLDTAKRAISLLQCQDAERAGMLAENMKKLNEERKAMNQEYEKKAFEMAQEMTDRVLVLYLPGCHESIAGIVAGRVKEKFHRPTLVLTDAEHGLKGSGRSIEAYHMFHEFSKVKSLFTKFGGHAMAAGVSLEKENLELLKRKLNENCNLTEDDLYLKVWIDMQLPLEYITTQLVEELNVIQPCGKGNEKPVFAEKDLKILKLDVREKVLSLNVENASHSRIRAVIFNRAGEFLEFLKERFGQEEIDKALAGRKNEIRFMATFYPSVNEYRGCQNLQIVIDRFC